MVKSFKSSKHMCTQIYKLQVLSILQTCVKKYEKTWRGVFHCFHSKNCNQKLKLKTLWTEKHSIWISSNVCKSIVGMDTSQLYSCQCLKICQQDSSGDGGLTRICKGSRPDITKIESFFTTGKQKKNRLFQCWCLLWSL